MAKVYFYKYKKLIDNGELTLPQVINLCKYEIPARWCGEVIDLLTKEYKDV